MNNYIKMLFIVIFLSNCSFLDKNKYNSNYLQTIYFKKNILNKNYIGMSKRQIIYLFGVPVIADSFNDVYHYHLYEKTSDNFFQEKMLNLYFKENKVLKFDIK